MLLKCLQCQHRLWAVPDPRGVRDLRPGVTSAPRLLKQKGVMGTALELSTDCKHCVLCDSHSRPRNTDPHSDSGACAKPTPRTQEGPLTKRRVRRVQGVPRKRPSAVRAALCKDSAKSPRTPPWQAQ